ncbi:hypothetical protein GQ457_12G015450 [Hibiscus cannabinus]
MWAVGTPALAEVVDSALAGSGILVELVVGDSGFYFDFSMRNLDDFSMLGYMRWKYCSCYNSQHSSLIRLAAHTPKHHDCSHIEYYLKNLAGQVLASHFPFWLWDADNHSGRAVVGSSVGQVVQWLHLLGQAVPAHLLVADRYSC